MRFPISFVGSFLLVMVGVSSWLAWPEDLERLERLVLEEISSATLMNDTVFQVQLKARGLSDKTRFTLYPDFGNRRNISDRLKLPEAVQGLVARGDLLYVANDRAGLVICDVSEPGRPVVLSNLELKGVAWKVRLMGDLALVLTVKDGLHLVDVSAPDFPVLRRTVKLSGSLVGLACNQHFAYVTAHREGIHIVDLKDSLNPVRLTTVHTPDLVRGVELRGDFLAVAGTHYGVLLYRGAESGRLKLDKPHNLRTTVKNVAFASDNRLYFSDTKNLYALDLDKQDNPVRHLIEAMFPIRALSVAGDRVYLGSEQGVSVYSRGPGDEVSFKGFLSNSSTFSAVALVRNRVFLGDSLFGLQSFPVDADFSSDSTGGYLLEGDHLNVKVADQRVFLSGNPYGLKVLERGGGGDFKVRSQLYDFPSLISLVRGEERIYLGDSEGGLVVLQNRQGKLEIVRRLTLPGEAVSMLLQRNHLLIADRMAGLLSFDLSEPDNPVAVDVLPSPGSAMNLALAGHHVFLAYDHGGLLVAELFEDGQLREVESLLFPDDVKELAVVQDVVVVALENGKLLQLVQDSSGRFQQDGIINVPGFVDKIAAFKSNLYVHLRSGEIYVLAVNGEQVDSEAIGRLDLVGRVANLRVQDDLLLVSTLKNGVSIYSLETPARPMLLEKLESSRNISDFLVDRDQVLGLTQDRSLALLPRRGASQQVHGLLGDRGKAVEIVGNLALIGSLDRLQIVDVSIADNLTVAGSLQLPGSVTSIKSRGGVAYVSVFNHGLFLVDISDYRTPRLLSSVKIPGKSWAFDLAGQFALVASGEGGLVSVDIADPQRPIVRDTLTLARPLRSFSRFVDVRAEGAIAYVADPSNGLVVVRLSASGELKVVALLNTPGYLRSLFLDVERVYLVDNEAGILVVDIADPEHPEVVCTLDAARGITDLWVGEEELLVLAGRSSFYSLPIPQNEIWSKSSPEGGVVHFRRPLQSGYYTLRAFGNAGTDKLVGKIHVSELGEVSVHRE